jgi:riboflavin-specific deaminase-like protein
VLVGAGTVLADDPKLTVRLVEGRSPMRVVVAGSTPLPRRAAVLDGSVPTLVAATVVPARVGSAEVLQVAADADGRVDLGDLLRQLADRGIGSVLVEGGARIITSFLRRGLANRLVVSVAPRLVGSGIEAVGDLEISRLRDALGFGRMRTWRLGEDLILDGDLERRAG